MGNITGHWTKYGGGKYDAHQKMPTSNWYCQSCNELQPVSMQPYLYEIMPEEYIKICSVCVMSDAYNVKQRILLQTTKITQYSKTYGEKTKEILISTATIEVIY